MTSEFRKYKDLFDTIEVGIVYQDADGTILEVNHSAENILGRSQDELINLDSHSETWKAIREDGTPFPGNEHPSMVALATGKKITNVIMSIYNPRLKEQRWISINAIPEFIPEKKKPFRVYTTFSDITENKLLLEELGKSQARSREAEHRVMLGNWDLDLKTDAGYWSEVMFVLFYRDPKLGPPTFTEFIDHIHPDDQKRLIEAHKEAISSECDIETEFRTNPKYGDLRIISAHFCCKKKENGKPVQLVGTCLDITEQKHTEEKLNLFKRAVDSSVNAVGISTAEGKHWYQNNAFSELFGDIGKDPPAILYANEKQGREIFQKIMAGDEWVGEVKMNGREGKILDIYLLAYPIKDVDGKIIGLVGIHNDITESKQSQKDLRLSKFSIDQAMDAIFWINREGKFIYVNEQACRILSYSGDELLNMHVWEIDISYQKELWNAEWDYYQNNKKEGRLNVESVFRCKDGSEFPVEISSQHFWFGEDELHVTYVRDITRRKKTEEQLKITQIGIDSAHIGVFRISDAGNVEYINNEACRMLGYTREELHSKTIFDIDVELDRNIWKEHRSNLHREKSVVVNSTHKRKDGTIFPVEVSVNLFEFEDKTTAFSFVKDITEQKKAKEILEEQNKEYQALNEEYLVQNEELVESIERIQKINIELEQAKIIAEESEKKYKAAFYTSPDAVNINTMEGIYVDANQGFLEITGYSCEEVLGKSSKELDIWAYPEEREKLISELEEKGVVENMEATFRMKSGELRSGLMSAAIITVEGKPHILSITRDITDRMKIEEDLRSAKERAEESDRLKTAFLANMSHEIRTPMNGILGFAELLKEPDLTGEMKDKYIELIQQSGERMLDIINDLVDISKIEAGQLELKIAAVNVSSVIEDLYDFFKPEFSDKGLNLMYGISSSGHTTYIKSDATKLTQILSNLLKNALKYTHKGKVEFGFRIRKGNADMQGNIEFYVKDTGIGIEPNLKDKIFERFRQGQISYLDGYEGTGLGLSISKAYVEALGGQIWVESEPDKGSVFHFSVPYIPAPDMNEEDKLKESTGNKSFQDITILIAEDDEVSFFFLEEILASQGIKIIAAGNGAKAIEEVERNQDIDLVLMDIKMPVLGGLEATKQIKKIKPELPVIIQTAFATVADQHKSYDAGCDGYIAKPINKDELLRKIAELVFSR